jgi:hypothetical protein
VVEIKIAMGFKPIAIDIAGKATGNRKHQIS